MENGKRHRDSSTGVSMIKKGFIINAEKRTIEPIEIKDYKCMQKAVRGLIQIAHEIEYEWPYVDTIFVDEEGLLKIGGASIVHGFSIEGGNQEFYVGNGLVLGADLDTGESIDARVTKEKLVSMISFKIMFNSKNMCQFLDSGGFWTTKEKRRVF